MSDARFAIPKLSGTNWQSWKIRLEMLLSRENMWYVVSEDVAVLDRDENWDNDDRKAKATIVLLLEDSQLALVKRCAHARDCFLALRNYHEKTSRSVRVSLLKKLCAINLSERGNMEEHLLEVDDLFDRLEAAGMELDKDTKVCMLLRSLPPSFDSLVSALDSRADDDVTLEVVKAKLTDEYGRRLERDGSDWKHEKAMRSEVNGDSRTCYFCKMPGHIKRNCRKYLASLNNDDSDSNGKKNEHGKAKAAHSEVRHVAFTVGSDSRSWIVDSGASAHMTSERSFFSELNEFAGGWITMADGQKTQILGEGRGVLYGYDDCDNVVRVDMSDVKFVPGLVTSLISVGKLAQKNLIVCFGKEDCKIVDAKGDTVVTGVRDKGLYHMRVAEAAMEATGENQHRENCQHLWHRRFGHRDPAATERILKEGLANGIKVSDCGLRLICETCLEGKSARAPFPEVVERKSSQILDIVHTDLCGPMKTETPSGNRYVMHVIDDYSRFTVTYLLKHKSEAADNMKDYVRWVENAFGRKPCIVRSDGGGEFDNRDLRKFYREEGIKPQFTTPYSPQQNGVAERKNRSITEMATCLLIDSGLEKRFWGEAVLTATYLQNRLPSRSVEKTPYELWWGRKPELGHLRVFGSEAYVHVPASKRTKMDSKARRLVFVGYSMQHKGYRFLDRETDSITISRDARFLELGNGSSVEIPVSTEKDSGRQDSTTKQEELEQEIDFPKQEEQYKDRDPLSDGSEHDEFEAGDEDQVGVRRSTRSTRGVVPRRLGDYVLGAVEQAFCAFEEPSNYREAMKVKQWRRAMEEKLDAHQRREVLEEADWAGDPENRQSTSGSGVTLPLGPTKHTKFCEDLGVQQ